MVSRIRQAPAIGENGPRKQTVPPAGFHAGGFQNDAAAPQTGHAYYAFTAFKLTGGMLSSGTKKSGARSRLGSTR